MILFIYRQKVWYLLIVRRKSAKRVDPSLTGNINSHRTTEVLYGADKAVGGGVQFTLNVNERIDIYFHRALSIVINIEEYRNGYMDIRRRGGKIRAFLPNSLRKYPIL
jgi:hypothetical protein